MSPYVCVHMFFVTVNCDISNSSGGSVIKTAFYSICCMLMGELVLHQYMPYISHVIVPHIENYEQLPRRFHHLIA